MCANAPNPTQEALPLAIELHDLLKEEGIHDSNLANSCQVVATLYHNLSDLEHAAVWHQKAADLAKAAMGKTHRLAQTFQDYSIKASKDARAKKYNAHNAVKTPSS